MTKLAKKYNFNLDLAKMVIYYNNRKVKQNSEWR